MWAGAKGLFGGPIQTVGMPYDDPDVTSADKLRYDACIVVEGAAEPRSGDRAALEFPGGEVLVADGEFGGRGQEGDFGGDRCGGGDTAFSGVAGSGDRGLGANGPAGSGELSELPWAGQGIDPDGGVLSYEWTQVYGPSILEFTDAQAPQTSVSTLEEGIYLLKLKVSISCFSSIV